MTELIIQPSAKDTELFKGAPDSNYGGLTYMRLLNWDTNIRRALLEFDLSGIPAGQAIISASLQLYYYLYENADPNGVTVWAYKLTRTDWVELEATWNIYKTGFNWTAAGGDYVTIAPVGGSTTFPAGYGWMSWDVLAIVQDAYAASNPAEFLVKFADETLTSGYAQPRFYSKDETTETTLRPKLVVNYTPAGWTGKISGVTNPAKVMGVDVANIAKVKGVVSA